MSFNTVQEIITQGRISLEQFTQSEIEAAIESADEMVDYRVPPLPSNHKHYSYYERRLPSLKAAHLNQTLAILYRVYGYESMVRGKTGDSWNVDGFAQGPVTPDVNVQMDAYIRLSNTYQERADGILKRCRYILPNVRLPAKLEL